MGGVRSVRLVRIRHSCGHAGWASTSASNPNTAVDVNRQRSRPCPMCKAVEVSEVRCSCGSPMHKHGKGWSGVNRRQLYQCPKCGRTRSLPLVEGKG